MDPAADVGVEVEVGVERKASLLDHGAHLVSEDPEHLGRRLDWTGAVGHLGLTEIVRQSLVDELLVVIAAAVLGLVPEEQPLGIEAAVTRRETLQFCVEAPLRPGGAEPLPHRGALSGRARGLEGNLCVVARGHLGEHEWQQISPYVDRASAAVRAPAERVESLVGTDQRPIDVATVLSGDRLRRERQPASTEQLKVRLTTARAVPQAAGILDELATTPDG